MEMSSMKVLCINGSPRPDGNTRCLTTVFERKMMEKWEIKALPNVEQDSAL
jgi:multimeric flavodoxin WrbA